MSESELTEEEQERLTRLKATRLSNQIRAVCDLAVLGSLLSGVLIGTLMMRYLSWEEDEDV